MTLVSTSAKYPYFHPDYLELLEFYGPEFRLDWCDADDGKGTQDANSDKYKDNEDFIRNTRVFVYQSIGLMVQGIHRPYIAKLLELTADQPASIIEVGAGGGQLGLALHTFGYKVSFADLYSQSFNFLTWRLHKRGLELPVYCLDFASVEIPQHDVAICFDVMEHCEPDEQLRLLHRLADMGKSVMVNLIADDAHAGLHFPVDFDKITSHCEEHWTTWWKNYYDGRQRLLIYGDGVRARKIDK